MINRAKSLHTPIWRRRISGAALLAAFAARRRVRAGFGAGHDPRRRVPGDDAEPGSGRSSNPVGDASVTVGGGARERRAPVGRHARRLGQQQLESAACARRRRTATSRSRRSSTRPSRTGFQQQGIIVEQDSNDLVRAEVHHDGGGTRLFVATIADGSSEVRHYQTVSGGAPLYLRVVRTGNTWRVRYSQRRLVVDHHRRLQLHADRRQGRPAGRQQRQPGAGLHVADRLVQGDPARLDGAGDQRASARPPRTIDATIAWTTDESATSEVVVRADDRLRQRQGRQRRARDEPQRRRPRPRLRDDVPLPGALEGRVEQHRLRHRPHVHHGGLPDDRAVRRVQRRVRRHEPLDARRPGRRRRRSAPAAARRMIALPAGVAARPLDGLRHPAAPAAAGAERRLRDDGQVRLGGHHGLPDAGPHRRAGRRRPAAPRGALRGHGHEAVRGLDRQRRRLGRSATRSPCPTARPSTCACAARATSGRFSYSADGTNWTHDDHVHPRDDRDGGRHAWPATAATFTPAFEARADWFHYTPPDRTAPVIIAASVTATPGAGSTARRHVDDRRAASSEVVVRQDDRVRGGHAHRARRRRRATPSACTASSATRSTTTASARSTRPTTPTVGTNKTFTSARLPGAARSPTSSTPRRSTRRAGRSSTRSATRRRRWRPAPRSSPCRPARRTTSGRASDTVPRLLQAAPNADFEVETKFDDRRRARPPSSRASSSRRATTSCCASRPTTRARRRACSSPRSPAAPPTSSTTSTVPGGAPVYLKLRRVGNRWTFSYSNDGESWRSTGFDRTLAVTAVGPYVGNGGSTPPAFQGQHRLLPRDHRPHPAGDLPDSARGPSAARRRSPGRRTSRRAPWSSTARAPARGRPRPAPEPLETRHSVAGQRPRVRDDLLVPREVGRRARQRRDVRRRRR